MDKNRVNKTISLSRVYRNMILIMVPVLMIGAITSISLGRSIQRQSLQVLRGNMDLQVKNLMDNLSNINYCLMSNLNSNGDLEDAILEENIYSKYNAITNLKNDFIEYRHYFGSDYNFFAYDSGAGKLYADSPDNIDFKSYLEIQKAIEKCMVTGREKDFQAANRKWNLIKTASGIEVLVKIYSNSGKTIGCFVLLDAIEDMFGVNNYSDNNSFMFLVADNKLLNQEQLYVKEFGDKEIKTYLAKSGEKVGGYDIYLYSFNKGSFSILSIIDTMGNYTDTLRVLSAFIVLLFIVLGVGIITLIYIRDKLIHPIHVFVDNLQDTNALQGYHDDLRFAELKQAEGLFQKARQQIKELKIAIYEQELSKKRLEVDYFQVQIKPHFYLNCLNIIYNMAQSGRFEEIQQLSMEVSNYMRTLFRSGMDFISVKEEMEHLKGYLNIQELRYSGNFTYKIEVAEEVLDYRILPLIVHTLVENSIKHTIMKNSVIHIEISVLRIFMRDEEYIKILVWDTGDGFSEEVLTALKAGNKLSSRRDGGRIGLSNMMQRLEYVYKKRAILEFANRLEGGAIVEILVPVDIVEEGWNESVDC